MFATSGERFAAVVHTSTVIFEEESDSFTIAGTHAVISGRFKAPVEVLAGSLPRRGDQGCDGRPVYESPDAVDVDGDRVAIGLFSDECTANNGPWDGSVVREASADEVVVRDLHTGMDVVRVTADDLAARGIDELALQDDGTVVFVVSNRHFSRMAWADRGRFYDLALAGGRVLYERVVRPFSGELLLADGSARRLAFFPERGRRVGDLDLDATRATWATRPTGRGYEPPLRGPARIVVRGL